MAVEICWHGGPSFTLRLGGLEVLVDPSFSRVGDYPAWFDENCANRGAPSVPEYLEGHEPRYLFITHGHFDHFDLHAVERLTGSRRDLLIAGSPSVLRTCREVLGLPAGRLVAIPLHGEGWLELDGGGREGGNGLPTRVAALPGPHWFTGAEGDAVSAKLAGRPERYGAMPCGGPMLGLLFEAGASRGVFRLWASGDTEPAGFPDPARTGPLDAAIVSCGGKLRNPGSRQLEGPFLDEASLARLAAAKLRPRVLVPVHYDHPVFQTRFDPELLGRELAGYPDPPLLLVAPKNRWAKLSP